MVIIVPKNITFAIGPHRPEPLNIIGITPIEAAAAVNTYLLLLASVHVKTTYTFDVSQAFFEVIHVCVELTIGFGVALHGDKQ